MGENTAIAAAVKGYRAARGKQAAEVPDRRRSLAGQKL